VPSIDVMAQTLLYTPAGTLNQRSDAADPVSSRYYGYDRLQRLTCEVRDGTSADCTTTSSKLAALYTYFNGQNGTSPPDTRSTAYIKQAT
jgi:hypothetical protein